MQLQQPLTLLHIALAPGQVLGMSRVYQIYREATFFQNLVQRNPIHTRRLHRYGLDSACLQPVRQTVQVRGEAFEPAYRLWVSVRTHCYVMGHIAHVDPVGLGCMTSSPGFADCNCRANSFLCFRFILPAPMLVLSLLKKDPG